MHRFYHQAKAKYRREEFIPTILGMVINPVYILRNGLCSSIKKIAPIIDGNVLDFGCGSKPYESLFTNVNSYIGVDIEVSGHNHSESKVDYFYDGKTLPFEDNQFDAVVSFEVFEHIFNISQILSELKRVLKPSGNLLISIPFSWNEHEAPYDFARYTSFGIKQILHENGFDVIELKKTTTYFLAIGQMFIAYLVQHIQPKNKWLGLLFQIGIIFPINLFTQTINFVLPKKFEYFCNIVVLARKQVRQLT